VNKVGVAACNLQGDRKYGEFNPKGLKVASTCNPVVIPMGGHRPPPLHFQ